MKRHRLRNLKNLTMNLLSLRAHDLFFLGAIFLPAVCAAQNVHSTWNDLLQRYVNGAGQVNYVEWKNSTDDKNVLNRYLSSLREIAPGERQPEEVRLVYWINIYNAYTVHLVLKYYPVASIKDIREEDKGPWDIPLVRVGKQFYTLNEVEHDIIRARFNEPRIHFALVCAARSCPPLLNGAYQPNILHQQLAAQTKAFINDSSKNKLQQEPPAVSAIFNWFAADFKKGGGTVTDYIKRYADTPLRVGTLSYEPYDWSLNSQL